MTQLLHQVKQLNQQRGALAGRSSGTPMVPMSGGVRVISAEMAKPPVLPEAEKAELDARAREIGILADEENESGPEIILPNLDLTPRQTAREATQQRSRLIDFKKVQGIDLHRSLAYVDGFEIEIPQEDTLHFKQYVMELAVDYVTKQLAEAIAALNDSQNVQEMSNGSPGAEVLPPSEGPTTDSKPLQEVRRKTKSSVGTRKPRKTKPNKKEVRQHSERSGENSAESP